MTRTLAHVSTVFGARAPCVLQANFSGPLGRATARQPASLGANLSGPKAEMVVNSPIESAWSTASISVQELAQPSANAQQLCASLSVQSLQEAKDVAASLILAEAVYKVLDGITLEEVFSQVSEAADELPELLQQDLKLQWSLPHVAHRYLIAEGETSIYVSLMGTKATRDLLTNASVFQALLWEERRFSPEGEPAVHSGFLKRARSVPAESLLKLAQGRRKKLVFCGHSLGGAVAEVCALDLLHSGRGDPTDVKAIGFATPAIGNAALARLVRKRGWQRLLVNYLLPEDRIGSVLGFSPLPNELAAIGSASATEASVGATGVPSQPLLGSEDKNLVKTNSAAAVPASLPEVPARTAGKHSSAVVRGNILAFRKQSEITACEQPALPNEKRRLDLAGLRHLPKIKEPGAARRAPLSAWVVHLAFLAYRALTFPLWAHKSFVPVGQRLYLNPEGICDYPGASAAALAAVKLPRALSTAQVEPSEAPHLNAERAKSQRLFLQMHRLPTYRARLLQIADMPPQVLKTARSANTRLSLAKEPALPTTLRQAVVLDFGGISDLRKLLDDCMRTLGLSAPWPEHWRHLAACAGLESPNVIAGLPGTISSLWSGLRSQLPGSEARASASSTIFIRVSGSGLEHITDFSLVTAEGGKVAAEVIEATESPLRRCFRGGQDRRASLGLLLAWLGAALAAGAPARAASEENYVLLRVEASAASAKGVKQANHGMRLTYRTDLQQGSLPITNATRRRLPTKRAESVVETLRWRPEGSGRMCQEC